MVMIHSKYPYGYVNINGVRAITKEKEKHYLIDDYGWWHIEEEVFNYLKSRGMRVYERVHPTT